MGKTRIQVALTEYEYDVVKRLSTVTGRPISKALHDQIEGVIPILEKVVESLEAAQRTEGSGRAKLVAQAMKLHKQMDEIAAHGLDQIDLFASAAQGHAAVSAASGATGGPTAPRTTNHKGKAAPKPVPESPTRANVRPKGARKNARRAK